MLSTRRHLSRPVEVWLLQGRKNSNHIRKQKKISSSSFGETVRIASLLHKGMKSGRSSYVEMRALARLTNHNIKTKIRIIKPLIKPSNEALTITLAEIPPTVSEGYTKVLNPNGMILEDSLDKLLSMDSEIAITLATIESHLRSKENTDQALSVLKEILKERKEFSESLRA